MYQTHPVLKHIPPCYGMLYWSASEQSCCSCRKALPYACFVMKYGPVLTVYSSPPAHHPSHLPYLPARPSVSQMSFCYSPYCVQMSFSSVPPLSSLPLSLRLRIFRTLSSDPQPHCLPANSYGFLLPHLFSSELPSGLYCQLPAL